MKCLFHSNLSLLTKFSIMAFLITAAIAIALAWGIQWRMEQSELRQQAEEAAVHVSACLNPNLKASDFTGPLSPDRFAQIDALIRQNILQSHIIHGHIVRIKIWNREGVLIYSDEKDLVGLRFPENEELKEALSGKIGMEVSSLKKEENIGERGRFARLMEVYVPLRPEGSPHIMGVFEIYHDLTFLKNHIAQTRRFIYSSVSLGFLILYGSLFLFVRNASRELIRRSEENAKLYEEVSQQLAERKKSEEALRESEEKFRELYDHAPSGYQECDTEGRISNVNRTHLEKMGYALEEMIGQPVWKFAVEEEESRQAILAKLAGTTPPSQGFERTFRRKDGTTFPGGIQQRALRDAHGRIIGITSTIQDITERKQAEEALKERERFLANIFSSIQDGLTAVDNEFNIAAVNPKTERNFQHAMPLVGKKCYEAYHGRTQPCEVCPALRTIETGKADYVVVPRIGESGKIDAYFDFSTFPLIDMETGKVKGVIEYVRDITERKRAEEEMAALQEQFRQSQKMEAIGKLAGGIAHDFNNLLTIISGYSEFSLSELKEDSPLKENIGEIKRASQQAADLTRQLLTFSRRQILEVKVLDLNIVLRDLDKMLHRVIREDIELVTLLAGDLGRVKTDQGQIEQVIMNLAVNARDAMPSGGKLTIETANVELDEEYARSHIAVTPGRYVMLSVSDTGVGMVPEVRERIFEPFFTTKEKGKGTGLGLSTVYGIVKQSGGNIWVYSEPGQGTAFKIYLPRVDEPLEEREEKVVKEGLPRGSETILLVEDNEEVRKLAVHILKKQGYTVLEACDGREALLYSEQHKGPFHLILVDVVMPGLSGRQMVEQLRQICLDFKVLYMSGYTENAIVHHGVLEKGINYIQKPFTVDGLARKVREVLDK